MQLGLVLVASALLLPSCLVNPVPTPGSASTFIPGDVALGDAAAGTDAQAAPDASGDAQAAVSLVHVTATATDSAVDAAVGGGVHLAAVATAVLATGELAVLLPDTGMAPTQYQALASALAEQGHRVLVLATPVSALAACAGDDTCLDLARQELLDGQDRTAKVTVTSADCLQNRLVKALAWLDKNRPGENWGTFYSGSTPVWSQIAIAGHGEGASEAAMVALHQAVWRVALLAGPTDGASGQAASWLAGTGPTDATAWRAFSHTPGPGFCNRCRGLDCAGLGQQRRCRERGRQPAAGNHSAIVDDGGECARSARGNCRGRRAADRRDRDAACAHRVEDPVAAELTRFFF